MREKIRGERAVWVAAAAIFLFSSLSFMPASRAEAGAAAHAVVNEVSVDSIVGTGGTDDDWIELYNPTGEAVSLDGWSIQKASASGSSLSRQALSGQIPAKSHFLIVRNGSSTSQALKDAADVLASDSFSLSNNNIVYLVNDNNNITGASDANIVDLVGFGTAAIFEGAAAAPAIPEGKSIARLANGEDTDQNAADFAVSDNPTPEGAVLTKDNEIIGTVYLTITPEAEPVKNISSTGADISFTVNAAGQAAVKYGLDAAYASSTNPENVVANVKKTLSLSGLQCGKTYHYAVYAENVGATENDQTEDAIFTTLPCGIAVHSLAMTRTGAKANNKYADGWSWKFNITVWDARETSLKMKFNQWSGPAALNAGGNMQFSVDNGASWLDIAANGAYPAAGANIGAIDQSAEAGRQVEILVRMKVPAGTAAGTYNSGYGILTE